jgi:hypothetical protein
MRLEGPVGRAGRDNAGAFLPAMLQGIESEKRYFGGVGVIEHGENAAFIPRAVLDDGLRRGNLMHSACTYT